MLYKKLSVYVQRYMQVRVQVKVQASMKASENVGVQDTGRGIQTVRILEKVDWWRLAYFGSERRNTLVLGYAEVQQGLPQEQA